MYLQFACRLGSGLESSMVQLHFLSFFASEPEIEQRKKHAGVIADLAPQWIWTPFLGEKGDLPHVLFKSCKE